jgi:peptidyl-prolyl isomerase E (cyclophilin E)
LEENVTEGVLHAAFIPFGDIKDVSMPLDQSTQKHRGFAFVTYLDKEDAAAAMDNMHNAELYGRVLTVNYAQPIKIKGGEQGWASQPGMQSFDLFFGSHIFCYQILLADFLLFFSWSSFEKVK